MTKYGMSQSGIEHIIYAKVSNKEKFCTKCGTAISRYKWTHNKGICDICILKEINRNGKKNKTQDVLQKMKERRGKDTIILFHNGDNFEAYEKDAQIIARELGLEVSVREDMMTAIFPQEKQEEYSNLLLDKGYAVCISEMRDISGNYITDIAIEEDE